MKRQLLSLVIAVLVGTGLAAPASAGTSASLPLSIGALKLASNGVAGLIFTTVRCPASEMLQTLQTVYQPRVKNSLSHFGSATYVCSGRNQALTLVADSCGADPCPRLQPGRNTVVQVSADYQPTAETSVAANALQVRRASTIGPIDGSTRHVALPPTGKIVLNGLTVQTSVTIRCPKPFRLEVVAGLRQSRAHGLAQGTTTGLDPGASSACTGTARRYPLAFELGEGIPWHAGSAFLDVTEFVMKGFQQKSSEFAYRTVTLQQGITP